MSVDDNYEAIAELEADSVDLIFDAPGAEVGARDDDELVRAAQDTISQWQAAATMPSLTQVQELFHSAICADASPMAREKIVAAIATAYKDELGGKRALTSTWTLLAEQVAEERAEAARAKHGGTTEPPLTAAQKAELRDALWPIVRELAEAPDLTDRVVRQVQAIGVVNERELVVLTYIAATSRVLKHPVNLLAKGASSSGKSFTTTRTLELIGSDFVNYLTSSSALSLVYDERPLANTVLVIYEANQIQADENSVQAMLLRSLISEGRIIHQTTVEDLNSPTGRRVECIVREGPIALVMTTTGELHAENETRMLSWHVGEGHAQTSAIMGSLADHAAGAVDAPADLSAWHDLQRWIAFGPSEVVVPFARQVTDKIPPLMIRFRRDVGALLTFVKASALLHQAQRQVDAAGRVVATVADYALAYPIFAKVLAQSSGKGITDNVRAVVGLVAQRAAATNSSTGRFTHAASAGPASEVTLSGEQIGTATGIGKSAACRAVNKAIELGFLINNETRRGKPYQLKLIREVDDAADALLPDPATITEEGGAA